MANWIFLLCNRTLRHIGIITVTAYFLFTSNFSALADTTNNTYPSPSLNKSIRWCQMPAKWTRLDVTVTCICFTDFLYKIEREKKYFAYHGIQRNDRFFSCPLIPLASHFFFFFLQVKNSKSRLATGNYDYNVKHQTKTV